MDPFSSRRWRRRQTHLRFIGNLASYLKNELPFAIIGVFCPLLETLTSCDETIVVSFSLWTYFWTLLRSLRLSRIQLFSITFNKGAFRTPSPTACCLLSGPDTNDHNSSSVLVFQYSGVLLFHCCEAMVFQCSVVLVF